MNLYERLMRNNVTSTFFSHVTHSLYVEADEMSKSGRDISFCQIDVDQIVNAFMSCIATCDLTVTREDFINILFNQFIFDAESAIKGILSVPAGLDLAFSTHGNDLMVFYGDKALVSSASADFKHSGLAAFC